MERRKHRLVVELTTSHPVTERNARNILTLLFDRIDLNTRPVWHGRAYGQKLAIKSFSRVRAAEERMK